MPYSGEVRLEKRVEQLELTVADASFLHITLTWVVCARDPRATPEDDTHDKPIVVREESELELIIEPATGRRVLRHECEDVEAFDELAAEAKRIDSRFTVTEQQLEIIRDRESRIVALLCGNRAGKSEVACIKLYYEWLLRGSIGALFWYVAPTRLKTQIGVKKLCKTHDGLPSIFPPEVILSFPRKHDVDDQSIRLIDGAEIAVHHAQGDGDNLKGDGVEFVVMDEFCSIKKEQNYIVTIQRLVGSRGQLVAVSTPKRGHWARSRIVAEASQSKLISLYQLSMFDNPWITLRATEEAIETSGGREDPTVKRDVLGEWVGDGLELWVSWNPKKHQISDEHALTIEDLVEAGRLPKGYRDITEHAVATIWRDSRRATVVIGQDFNLNPMAGVVAKIFGIEGDPNTWGLYIFDEVVLRADIHTYADKLEGLYPKAPMSCDSTGDQQSRNQGQGAGSSTNVRVLRSRGFLAEPCWRRKGASVNPRQSDSVGLMNWLFRQTRVFVNRRCRHTIKALETQEVDPSTGGIAKQPGKASDRLSAPTDGMRYLGWKFWGQDYLDIDLEKSTRREIGLQ